MKDTVVISKIRIFITVRRFKLVVKILALDEKILDLALISVFNDFEDAIQYFTALENGCEVIITRNKKDFRNVLLPVMTADEFIKF